MRIELVQFTPTFPGRDANWRRILAWARASPADIVVFPELSTCGYMYDDPKELEPYRDTLSALAPLEKLSRDTGKLIVGGFAEQSGDRTYNSAYAVAPDGTTVYRKIHLWNREKLLFEPGDELKTLTFQGRTVGLEVCYDVQFPEQAAYLARNGVELLLAPTAWAEDPHGAIHGLQPYTILASATGFAYGVCVAVVNRTGTERGASFPGQSSLVDPFGQLTLIDSADEGHLVADIPFEGMSEARRPTPYNDLATDGRMTIAPPAKRVVAPPVRAPRKRRASRS